MNWGTPEIAEAAQKEILGEDHAYPMIAFGTLKKKSAFKLYARAQQMDFELANTISAQIEEYEKAYSFADDEDKEDINIYDFVEPEYHRYLDASKRYQGIIMDRKKAPCAYLLYSGSIREDIGLIKCKSEATKKEYITAVIDGAVAEKYKFLKNDLLKVDVVKLIDMVFKRAGIPAFNIDQLSQLVKTDKAVWDIYAKGFTIGVNQVERKSTTQKVMKYKPSNVSELSAFIAAIRPAFKSMYPKFENREKFAYGIPAFDALLQTEELPESFILYQEQTMNTLNYAGFPIDECYGIIKAIAKKHPEKVKPLKEKFISGFRDRIIADGVSPEKAENDAARVWQIISDSCGYGFNCVSGDTIICKTGNNGEFIPTVEEMYNICNNYAYAKKTGHLALRKKYRRYGYGEGLSLYADNRLYKNRIVGIYPAGERITYRITTESGRHIVCTDNHKFPTTSGKKRTDELKIGDQLYCCGNYEISKYDYTLTDKESNNYPHKGEMGFQTKADGASVIYNSERTKHKTRQDECEMCGSLYSEELRFELHHIDGNRKNNNRKNLMWLCNSCHKKVHYKMGRNHRYDKGIPTVLEKIVSIEEDKKQMTYDVEMASPAHTFLANDGIVTSNSAHAYCMALDSLYNAYLKAHYPYEFYEVLLQAYSEKGDKDKVMELKKEMQIAFDIKEGDYRFGLDNRHFRLDKENHLIYPSLLSIKGLSQVCAETLYNLSQNNHYTSFYDLWKDIKASKSVDNGQLEILVNINYFAQFGCIGKIRAFLNATEELYERAQFNKSKLPAEYSDIIIKNSTETKTQYRNFDYESALYEIWNLLPDDDIDIQERIRYELEHLGYIKSVFKIPDKRIAYITDVKGNKKSTTVKLHYLTSGNSGIVKIRNTLYRACPVQPGDIIRIIHTEEEGRWSRTETGKWIQSRTEMETILYNYDIANNCLR